jgi:hypothetical protein
MTVALIGIAVTTSALMFALIAWVDGLRVATFVMGFTAAAAGLLAGVAAFWLWVGGVFA